MKTNYYWIIGVVVVIAGLFWWSNSLNQLSLTEPTRDFPVPVVTEVTEFDQIKGSTATSSVLVVEYSDFQCPACRSYYPLVKATIASTTDVTFVYRHFPLQQHFNAKKAAIAAEAAGLQGKFWEMHDMLFEKQDEWGVAVNPQRLFIGYAEDIGLDTTKFEADLSSGDLNLKVERDYESGVAAGVVGTPTFFMNGNKIDNPSSIESFKQLLESAKAQ